jgi:hypothetical protein
MKTTAVLLMAFTAFSSLSQENYTLRMTVHMEGLPPEYAAYGDQEIVTYIKGEKSRTEVSSVMYSSTVYFDGDTLVTLNDVMGDRKGFKASKKELEAADTSRVKTKPVVKYTTEKKTIAGYECTKAVITQEQKNKEKSETIAWVTDRIKASQTPRKAAGRGVADLGDLKGQPLEMEISHNSQGNNVKIIMTTTEVLTAPLHDSLFVPNTSGYTMRGFEEWQKQMKGQQK